METDNPIHSLSSGVASAPSAWSCTNFNAVQEIAGVGLG